MPASRGSLLFASQNVWPFPHGDQVASKNQLLPRMEKNGLGFPTKSVIIKIRI